MHSCIYLLLYIYLDVYLFMIEITCFSQGVYIYIYLSHVFFWDLSITHGVQVGPTRQGEVWEQAIPLRQDHDAHH